MQLSETDVCSLPVVCKMDIMAFVLRIRYVNEYYAFTVQHIIGTCVGILNLHSTSSCYIAFPFQNILLPIQNHYSFRSKFLFSTRHCITVMQGGPHCRLKESDSDGTHV